MFHYWDLINSSLMRSSVVPFHSGIVHGKNAFLYISVLVPICRNLMLFWLLVLVLDAMRCSSAGIATLPLAICDIIVSRW